MKVKPLSQFSTFLLILAEKVFYKSAHNNTKKNYFFFFLQFQLILSSEQCAEMLKSGVKLELTLPNGTNGILAYGVMEPDTKSINVQASILSIW